ncbi:hypothetical protein ACGF07_30255 [Kitasatospora sp. NPDC048194]|uniref:hypothetical protein n=1 Tax=Kitasatospora sp. NPDC048194 TaxID=3364045 RepID=UPI00371E7005
MPEDSVPVQDAPPPEPGPEQRPAAPRRRLRLGDALWAAAPFAVGFVGLALTVLGFVRFTDTFEEIRAYRATPACTAAAAPGDDCATSESGRVTEKSEESDSDSTSYVLTVAREKAPSARYSVGEAFYDDVAPGTIVELKILRGRVFELSYHGHRSQPPNTPYLEIIEFSALIGVGLVMVVASLFGDFEFTVALSLMYSVGVWIATAVGSVFLITVQWPLIVTLAVGVACWLFAAYLTYMTYEMF